MPSFDIASKVDPQTVENAINVAKKEIQNRYDFSGSKTEVEFDKKELSIKITTENEMRLNTVLEIIISRGGKQGLDPRSYDVTKEHYPSGPMIKKDLKMKNGLDKEAMKKISKAIKDGGSKVQAAQMDQIVRVSSKKIDELQAVMADLRRQDFGFPLQFENMKS